MKYLKLDKTLNDYVSSHSVHETEYLKALRVRTKKETGRGMMISAEQAQLIKVLIKAANVKKIIEVGVFTGYSSIVMGQALAQEGSIECFDQSEEWTNIAREGWRINGLEDKISLTLGAADQGLKKLLAQGGAAQYDLVFIDANKTGYSDYYAMALELVRSGGMIILDNMLLKGNVANLEKDSEDLASIRRINQEIHIDNSVVSCLLPIGDGMTVAIKN